jgi:hypothetical protein
VDHFYTPSPFFLRYSVTRGTLAGSAKKESHLAATESQSTRYLTVAVPNRIMALQAANPCTVNIC